MHPHRGSLLAIGGMGQIEVTQQTTVGQLDPGHDLLQISQLPRVTSLPPTRSQVERAAEILVSSLTEMAEVVSRSSRNDSDRRAAGELLANTERVKDLLDSLATSGNLLEGESGLRQIYHDTLQLLSSELSPFRELVMEPFYKATEALGFFFTQSTARLHLPQMPYEEFSPLAIQLAQDFQRMNAGDIVQWNQAGPLTGVQYAESPNSPLPSSSDVRPTDEERAAAAVLFAAVLINEPLSVVDAVLGEDSENHQSINLRELEEQFISPTFDTLVNFISSPLGIYASGQARGTEGIDFRTADNIRIRTIQEAREILYTIASDGENLQIEDLANYILAADTDKDGIISAEEQDRHNRNLLDPSRRAPPAPQLLTPSVISQK